MSGAEPREAGLTLAQYATVRAGTAEPFSLEEVLGIEGIDAAVWAEAELAWTARLASDEASMKEYEALLAAAQDRLSRKIEPIAGDVEAWLAFLAEYVAAANAQAVLDRRGLGVNDLARLSRTWARRLEREPELQKRAAEIRRRGPKKLSPLVLGARRLRASGVPAPVERAASTAKSTTLEPAMELERYARLSAELLASPRDRAGVLARFDLSAAALTALEEGYRDRLRADAAMASDFARLRDHHRARIAARASAPPDEAARSSPKPVWNIEEPGTVVAAAPDVAAPALPFRQPQGPVADAPVRASVVAGGGSDGETVTLPSPFAQAEIEDEATVIRASPFASAPPPLPPAALVEDDLGTSAPVPSPFADNPLPFETTPVATPAIAKRVEPPPVRLDSGTVSAVMSPFAVGSPTPFGRDRAPSSSRAPLPPPKPPPRRRSVAPPPPTSTRSPAPVSTRAPMSERHPPMTLEHHAALCAEIAIQPGHEAEVLARNGVDGDLKLRADAFWKEQAAKDPAARAAWTRAFDAYHQMFTRGR